MLFSHKQGFKFAGRDCGYAQFLILQKNCRQMPLMLLQLGSCCSFEDFLNYDVAAAIAVPELDLKPCT